MRLALFRNLYDNRPKAIRVDYQTFGSMMTTRYVFPGDPRHAPMWSPTIYPKGAKRAKANVTAVTALCLDYDEDVDLDAVADTWARYLCWFHTSKSHRPDAPRVRIVLPLTPACPVDLWARLWLWAWQRTGETIDRACKDPGRIYALPYTRTPGAPFEAGYHPGVWLDWRSLTLPELEQPKPPPRRRVNARTHEGADRHLRRQVSTDPDLRRQAGLQLGGVDTGETIKGVRCPACGDTSVWWPLNPVKVGSAMCHHRNSCQWMGHILDL